MSSAAAISTTARRQRDLARRAVRGTDATVGHHAVASQRSQRILRDRRPLSDPLWCPPGRWGRLGHTWRGVFLRGGIVNTAVPARPGCPVPSTGSPVGETSGARRMPSARRFDMDVPVWVWLVTVAGLAALFALDLFLVDRKPHAIEITEAARWVVFYFACAVVFG